MNTLKQLQEKGEAEFKNKFFVLYDSDMSGLGTDQVDSVLDFLHQQTTLAFEAGKAEAIAMVLKEIGDFRNKTLKSFKSAVENSKETAVYSGQLLAFTKIEDTLKTKLTAKE